MTKISLVQLSQLENKPKKLKFKNTEFTLQTNSCYVDKFKVGLDNYIYFEEFNEPLIEIVEEVLLNDEDKECLKCLLKISWNKNHKSICLKQDMYNEDRIYFILRSNGGFCNEYSIENTVFKNLEIGKYYKISDLGLYDEE